MKLKIYIFCIFSIGFVNISYAASSLLTACNSYNGTMLTNVLIQNYNNTTIGGDISIRTSGSSIAWYSVSGDNYNAPYLYDMVKTARLTGERVDICHSNTGHYLLGVEWTRSAS